MNVTSVNTPGAITPAAIQAALKGESVTPKADLPGLLKGSSVTVTSAGNSDLEKLAALLLEESNKARREAQTEQMKTLSSGVLERLREKNMAAYTVLNSVANQIKALESQGGDANKDKIAELEKTLDKLVSSLDGESYRLLMEGAQDVGNTQLLEEEEEEKVGNIPLDERSVDAIIRDSLRRLDGDLLDSLETRRESLV